jgi:hypothetical protein
MAESGFIKRIPVEIQDVRFKQDALSDATRKNPEGQQVTDSTDPMRAQLGTYPVTEGKPFGRSENQPAAAGAPGINPDLRPIDVGLVPGGA